MAVTSFKWIGDGRDGGDSFDQSADIVRIGEATTDSDEDSTITVLASPLIPPLGFPYLTPNEGRPWLRVRDRRATQRPEDMRIWRVRITYSNKFDARLPGGGSGGAPGAAGGQPPTDRTTNPLAEPVRWGMSFVRVMESVLEDLDGFKVLNSAGVPFANGYERPMPVAQVTAQKNYSSFLFADAEDWYDAVNVGTWHGLPNYSVKVDGITIQEEYRNDTSFLAVTWTFLVNTRKLWYPTKILNKGSHYKRNPGVDDTLVPFRDRSGNPYEGLLTATGGALAAGAAPTYQSFRFNDLRSFAGIP